MSILSKTLLIGAAELGIELSERQLKQFEKYYFMIAETNKSLNLTSIVEEKDVAVKHFIDSLTCLKAVPVEGEVSLLDVGAGAGLPGIPIKICRPAVQVTLVEAQEKKVVFLKKVIKELSLSGIEAVHARAEDAGRSGPYREKFDLVVARAVASMRVLSEYCLPTVKTGGLFLAMKGSKIEEEMAEAKNAFAVLGGMTEDIINLRLPFAGDERNLVIIRKVGATPDIYPRRPGTAKKKPL